MEETKTSKVINRKFEPGIWIGIIAILINIITVSVYVYQARIMQQQQHASAWPYIEWLPSFNEETYFVEISNNGIGPAIINDIQIELNGQEIKSIDSVFLKLVGTCYFPHLTSTIKNRVLPAGKSLRLFQINDSEWASKAFLAIQKQSLNISICYSSIYGDSWVSAGVTVYQGSCTKKE